MCQAGEGSRGNLSRSGGVEPLSARSGGRDAAVLGGRNRVLASCSSWQHDHVIWRCLWIVIAAPSPTDERFLSTPISYGVFPEGSATTWISRATVRIHQSSRRSARSQSINEPTPSALP